MLRGGAYKPRTSPYDFQGLGIEALKILREATEETGLPVVTEVMSTEDLDLICEYVDMLQVGARNMQNFALLRRLATVNKQLDTVNETGVIGGQEQRGAGNFVSFTDTPHGDQRGHIVEQALLLSGIGAGQFNQARRAGGAGAEGVDAHLAVFQVQNPVAGK